MFNDFENITHCLIFRQGDKISHQNTSFINNGVFLMAFDELTEFSEL